MKEIPNKKARNKERRIIRTLLKLFIVLVLFVITKVLYKTNPVFGIYSFLILACIIVIILIGMALRERQYTGDRLAQGDRIIIEVFIRIVAIVLAILIIWKTIIPVGEDIFNIKRHELIITGRIISVNYKYKFIEELTVRNDKGNTVIINDAGKNSFNRNKKYDFYYLAHSKTVIKIVPQ